MSGEAANDDEDHDFVRPFLTAGWTGGTGGPDSAGAHATPPRETHGRADDVPAEESSSADFVRPYFVTGGRVHDGLGDFSTVYALSAKGRAELDSLTFESRQIAGICHEAQSVAEISAHLRLPLGVVTVLTRDLFATGHLSAASPSVDPASDVTLIARLIHAVHAL